ncbi:hypothetical protein [Streptomyces sp. TRM68416]|uniref:hypothetical protein n=1 Tax=Streptomyces sp. TRM68416 TaxID=2758412 RepID=UPI0016619558|nr:hypothetical protein [Streptomyces sp. TRM68416]MBD0837358.1 hypothetical protein [Streptomyces sp. TRM68416]
MSAGATGMGAVDSMVAWSVAIAALSGLGALLWRVLRAVLRIADRVDEAWEDWAGSEGRPGVPARPGVMSRLGDHDHRLDDHDHRLDDHEQRITRVETRIPDTSP